MKKFLVFGIVLLVIGMSVAPPTGCVGGEQTELFDNKTKVTSEKISSGDNETEYWALLVAAGIYAGHPDENRPEVLTQVEDLRQKLLVSDHWKDENIKVIKGRRATLFNIIRGLRWLDRKEDENDISLVYITTHGGPHPRDRFPWDEEDGCDEILATYLSFMFPRIHLSDDLLNLFLSLLNSKGVCVIIDSCHSGGFNDTPYFSNGLNNNNMTAVEWMYEFADDIRESGRVVLMSCSEDELAPAYVFTHYLTEGLTGYADGNEDDLVSAEEVFNYTVENIEEEWGVHPTIFDDYDGELLLTEAEFPPSRPETPLGEVIGNTNTTYYYSTKSIDPEGKNISYGWDWDGDFVVDEWTDFVESNTTVNISHSWAKESVNNIRVIAKDERGVISEWSKYIVVIMCSDYIPDQQQTIQDEGIIFGDSWIAQSFVPSSNLLLLSKVDLSLFSGGPGDPPTVQLFIRDSLSGENLAECSQTIPETGWDIDEYAWFTFDFDDIELIPGNTYYIVFKGASDWGFCWRGSYDDPYPFGKAYYSESGSEWHAHGNTDLSFVTWARELEYPIVFNPTPKDDESWIPVDITQISFNLYDSQGDLMDYMVETSPDIGTGNGYDVEDGKYSIDISDLEYATVYRWFVNVTDGEHWNRKVFSFKTQPVMVFNPFDEGWQYRKKITIDHNKVTGNVTDFPILISDVDEDLKNKAQEDGSDILFMDNSGVANRLFHEFEIFDGSSGELVVWVNITNLSSSEDTVLYMYYGNSWCDSQEYPDHAWDSDYCGVWHLNDFLDSTSNNNDGTNFGTDSCSGKIDIAKDFVEANEDYVSFGDMPKPADGNISKGTFEVWINPDELAGRSIISKLDTSLEPDRKSYHWGLKDTGQMQFSVQSGKWYQDGRYIRGITEAGHVTCGVWQHIVVAVDIPSQNITFYYNGVEIDVNVTSEGILPTYFYDVDLDERLGKYSPESTGPYFFNGSMDEVRISKTCRSAAWVSTEYNNQDDPLGFLSFGPEETEP